MGKKNTFKLKKELIKSLANKITGGQYTEQELEDSFNECVKEQNEEKAKAKAEAEKKKKTPKCSKEDAKIFFKSSMLYVNLANVLADVVDSVVLDAESYLNKIEKAFSQKDKQSFNNMRSAVKSARTTAKAAARTIYHLDEQSDIDDAIADSDAIYEIIKLLVKKCDGQDEKFESVKNLLESMDDAPVSYNEEDIDKEINDLYSDN